MANQVYMTAKLNLADGTIVYPQVSLDNIVASISDPTLVSVATTTNGKVPIVQLPTTLTVTESDTTVPTAGAVYTALGAKQNTLVEGDNIIHIINGSTIMADITNLDVAAIDTTTVSNGVHLTLTGGNTVGVTADYVTGETAGVLAGVSDGIALANGIISADVGSGLKVGAGTDAGKIVIDEASVDTTLLNERVVSGTTVSPVDDQVVTPGNLRGALSVGQAVDVSCSATINTWDSVDYIEGDSFLGTFELTKAATAATGYYFGFSGSAPNKFPKAAPGLLYLMIMDVKNSGSLAWGGRIAGSYPGLEGASGATQMPVLGVPYELPTAALAAGATNFTRIAVLFSGDNGRCVLTLRNTEAGTLKVTIKNFRVYEVTALTNEAISYIAKYGLDPVTSIPSTTVIPDAFFRSSAVDTVLDKYLVKQDMVCPWVKTISMPDDSDLTVAAGLAYKIRYLDDTKPHNVTVDTIPADAYGQDAHIQMFVKGASAVKFNDPLVLMDPLKSNAGHDLIVKFRNGQAFVYVDDFDAGYVVTVDSGIGDGTLNFGIVDPGTDYVIFAATLDGTTVDAGTAVFGSTATTLTALNILGNGTDKTTITGDISVASGKTMNLQELSISGGTYTNTGYIALNDVGITENATVVFKKNAINPTDLVIDGSVVCEAGITSTQNVKIAGGSNSSLQGSITMTGGSGNTIEVSSIKSWTPTAPGYRFLGASSNAPTSSVHITGCTIHGSTAGFLYNSGIRNLVVTDTTFTDLHSTGSGAILWAQGKGYKFVRCKFVDNHGISNDFFTESGGAFPSIEFDSCSFISTSSDFTNKIAEAPKSCVAFSGTNTIKGFFLISGYPIRDMFVQVATNTSFDVRGANSDSKYWNVTDVTFGDNISIILTDSVTAVIDACKFNYIGAAFNALFTNTGVSLTITGSSASTWRAINITFNGTIDASDAPGTILLSGSTFSAKACVRNANRIQLPAATTVSFQGNSNVADTKILEAPVIVVGDDAAAPSGSATVVNAAGTTSTISGIGTYIDKEGDNDFVPLTSVSTVSTSATSGAGSLPVALTDSNKFVRLGAGTVGTVGEATDAVDKTVMTNEYEPIIGGTFSLTSATVDEDTKTTTILEGGTMSIVNVTGGKSSVIDCGGTDAIAHGTYAPVFSGVSIINYSATTGIGYKYGASPTWVNCVVVNNRPGRAAIETEGNGGAIGNISNCTVTGNYTSDVSARPGSTINLNGGNVIGKASVSTNGKLVFKGANKVDSAFGSGIITLTSGATLDLTENSNPTPIAPGGEIVFEEGGATVYPSAGSASAVSVNIAGGTFGCSTITNSGVLVMPNAAFPITTGAALGGNATIDVPNQSVVPNVTFSGVTFSGSGHIVGNAGATITFDGCTVSVPLRNRTDVKYGNYVFAGDCTVNYVSNDSGVTNGTVTLASGAILDLTGNSNATPIAPGEGITFEEGGATVLYSSGAVSGSYMMDNVELPAGAKLTNTAVVGLGNVAGFCYGSASGVTLVSGYFNVYSGGTVNYITLNSGGYLAISSGGMANNAIVDSSGATLVYLGGTVANTTVNSGGRLYASSGGTANEPIINSGGSLIVVSGGSALLVTSNTGANVTVQDGGYITYK